MFDNQLASVQSTIYCSNYYIHGVIDENIESVTCKTHSFNSSLSTLFLPSGFEFKDGIISGKSNSVFDNHVIVVYSDEESVPLYLSS